MTPTLIGVATVLIGAWLILRRSIMGLFCATLALGLLGGSAAVILNSLGGSSVPPSRVMLGFLLAACLLRFKDDAEPIKRAVTDNVWLIIFCLYGVLSAFLLPWIFQGAIDLVPLRPAGLRHLFDAFPLHFSNQNVTTAVYLLGTLLAALGSYLAVVREDNLRPFVTAAIAITAAHAILGIMGAALRGTPWDLVVEFFRNGSYSQLNQETRSFVRINGLMPEPSSFAQFGVGWFILCFELWVRHVRPKATGIAAALLAAVLILSTSSTAYIGLAGYAAIFAARMLFFPSYMRADKWLALGAAALAGILLAGAAILLSNPIAREFEDMLRQMTVEKADSLSGQQRLFWARQGLDAFFASYGLGVGAGSFRSSSIVTAILGGMGVVGAISFIAYLLQLLWPQRAHDEHDEMANIADATAWAAVAGLVPGLVMQASPDPGLEFACLAGVALALKSRIAVTRNLVTRRPALEEVRAPAARPQAGWRHVSR